MRLCLALEEVLYLAASACTYMETAIVCWTPEAEYVCMRGGIVDKGCDNVQYYMYVYVVIENWKYMYTCSFPERA